MTKIEDLDTIKTSRYKLEAPVSKIDPLKGQTRFPLIFLVDVSGTMDKYKDKINDTLHGFISDIKNSKDGKEYMVDLAIITFGGNEVKIRRPFDLLDKDEDEEDFETNFQIDACGGSTPLGAAMLQAYYYAVKRKEMYHQAELPTYQQPTVVLISDLQENDFYGLYREDVWIDGNHYQSVNQSSGHAEIFEQMAELYTYAHKKAFKQFTYFIGIGNVDNKNRELLDVYSMDETGGVIEALKRVLYEYGASIGQMNPVEANELSDMEDMDDVINLSNFQAIARYLDEQEEDDDEADEDFDSDEERPYGSTH